MRIAKNSLFSYDLTFSGLKLEQRGRLVGREPGGPRRLRPEDDALLAHLQRSA